MLRILLILALIQLAESFHKPFGVVWSNGRAPNRNIYRCTPATARGSRLHESGHPFTAEGSLAIKVKIPTQDRSMVDRFLRETDYLIDNIWDKTKVKKLAPEQYRVQISVIPVPGLSIVSPEIEVGLNNYKGILYVNCEKFVLKDGCGKPLTDPALASLQVSLIGKLRISNSNNDSDDENETEKRTFVPKRPIGGPQVYVEGSAEYKISCPSQPESLQLHPHAFDQVAALLRARFDEFMQNRLPLKLAKTFKAYAANIVKNREFW